MAKKGLSHEQIWDDSILVTSWNDALQEYKKYHSLAAKGEKIEVVLDKAEQGIPEEDSASIVEDHQAAPETAQLNGHASKDIHGQSVQASTSADASSTTAQPTAQPAVGGAPGPQALLQSIHDEGLKNMMMSWYYAGYYTGLYEGQQKGRSATE